MSTLLCISVRFLQPYAHGRDESGEPEWPPSPLRLMQALVAASAGRWNEGTELRHAVECLRLLEKLEPPEIVAAKGNPSSTPYRLYVPDNVTDKVAGAWSRGADASIADYRSEKDVRPTHLHGDSVHYLYRIPATDPAGDRVIDVLQTAARAITHLGWGIDMATGDAAIIGEEHAKQLPGIRWRPSPVGGKPLRVPRGGTLTDLSRKHAAFLNRMNEGLFQPVPPLREFEVIHYRNSEMPIERPWRAFELRNTDGTRFRYPHRKLIHLAGMLRHVAVETIKRNPPRGVGDDWVESYVAGHSGPGAISHRQLSYLPLPSIGHPHADPGVRRIMIAAPVGDEAWLDHIVRSLAGQILRPIPNLPHPFPADNPPMLIPLPPNTRDGVLLSYTAASSVWHSFTPVILPGHDDHKPTKTRALIEKALHQAGIEQPCEFEWAATSKFPKSYSSHKYDRVKKPQGFYRPSYLMSQTAVHLTIRFANGLQVPGPLAIGAGRHCGFGVMAVLSNSEKHEP